MLDNKNFINSLIYSFSGSQRIVAIPHIFIKLTGSLNAAAVLNQCIYYSDITTREDGYFYKTYGEWYEELELSKYQINNIINNFKKQGIVSTKLKKANGVPTLHYKINIDVLADVIKEKMINSEVKKFHNRKSKNFTNDDEKISHSLTENYTENYTNNELSAHDYNSNLNKNQQENTRKTKVSNDTKNNTENQKENVFDYYQKVFGILNAKNADNLNLWIDDFNEKGEGEAIVKKAMDIALDNNAQSFKYAETILKNWAARKLMTLNEVEKFAGTDKKVKNKNSSNENTNLASAIDQFLTGGDE